MCLGGGDDILGGGMGTRVGMGGRAAILVALAPDNEVDEAEPETEAGTTREGDGTVTAIFVEETGRGRG